MSACEPSDEKKYKQRNSPPIPANQCPANHRAKGNDGNWYVAKPNKNGVNRWVIEKVETPEEEKPSLLKKITDTITSPLSLLTTKKEIPYEKCDKTIKVAKLKEILTEHNVTFKKSSSKAELCKLVQNLVHGTSEPSSDKKEESKKDCKGMKVAEIRKLLDEHEIVYKKSDKKADLCAKADSLLNKSILSYVTDLLPSFSSKKEEEKPKEEVKCDRSVSIKKLKELLTENNIEFKKSEKKSSLCEKAKHLL